MGTLASVQSHYLEQVEAEKAPRGHHQGIRPPPHHAAAVAAATCIQAGVAPRVEEGADEEDEAPDGQHLSKEIERSATATPVGVVEPPQPQWHPEEEGRGAHEDGGRAQRKGQTLLPRHGMGRQGSVGPLLFCSGRVQELGGGQPVEEGGREEGGLEGGGEGPGQGVPVEPVRQLQGQHQSRGEKKLLLLLLLLLCAAGDDAPCKEEEVEVHAQRAQDPLQNCRAMGYGYTRVEACHLVKWFRCVRYVAMVNSMG